MLNEYHVRNIILVAKISECFIMVLYYVYVHVVCF